MSRLLTGTVNILIAILSANSTAALLPELLKWTNPLLILLHESLTNQLHGGIGTVSAFSGQQQKNMTIEDTAIFEALQHACNPEGGGNERWRTGCKTQADIFEQMMHAIAKRYNVLRSGTKNPTDRNLEPRELQKREKEGRQIWEQGLIEVQMAQDNEHFKCTYIEFSNQNQRSTPDPSPDPSSDEDLNQKEEDENSEKTTATSSNAAAGGRQQVPPSAQKTVLRAQMKPAECCPPPTGLSMEEWQMIMEKRNQTSTSGTSPKTPDDSKKRKKKPPSDLGNPHRRKRPDQWGRNSETQ